MQTKKKSRQEKTEVYLVRKFATPTTSEDAELQLPPLAEQLGEVMTEQDIIERGTLLQKAKLYYTLLDYDGYFGSSEDNPEEVKSNLIASVKSKEDMETLKQCAKEFAALQKYGQRLSYFFKRFQTSFAILARLLNLWDSYEKVAQNHTNILRRLYEDCLKQGESLYQKGERVIDYEGGSAEDYQGGGNEQARLFAEVNANGYISNVLHCSGEDGLWEGACLRFDYDKWAFYADVELKGGRFWELDIALLDEDFKERARKHNQQEKPLYLQIQEEATTTTEALSDFKAYAVVVGDFLKGGLSKKSVLRYMPISIQMSIENAEEERFTRYLVKNLSFFRSEINQRRSKGETITPEEEKRAVIPDFYEVEPTAEVYEDCRDGLLENLD